MYRIYYLNFGYSHHTDTLEAARADAKRAGFQAVIFNPDGKRVCSYCPLFGWRQQTST